MDTFWETIEAQLADLEEATTAARVIEILGLDKNPYGEESCMTREPNSKRGFFAGSGGDGSVRAALGRAGWRTTWAEASYYYVMEAPNGDLITYVEGDVYVGDTVIR